MSFPISVLYLYVDGLRSFIMYSRIFQHLSNLTLVFDLSQGLGTPSSPVSQNRHREPSPDLPKRKYEDLLHDHPTPLVQCPTLHGLGPTKRMAVRYSTIPRGLSNSLQNTNLTPSLTFRTPFRDPYPTLPEPPSHPDRGTGVPY